MKGTPTMDEPARPAHWPMVGVPFMGTLGGGFTRN